MIDPRSAISDKHNGAQQRAFEVQRDACLVHNRSNYLCRDLVRASSPSTKTAAPAARRMINQTLAAPRCSMNESVPWKIDEPDELAMLICQQHLAERGFSAALAAIERQTGIRYLQEKLPRGSMLLEMVYKQMEEEALRDKDTQEVSRLAVEEAASLRAAPRALPVRLRRSVEGRHTAVVTSLALSGDCSAVYTGTGDGRVQRMNLEDGEPQWTVSAGSGGILTLVVLQPTASGQELLVAGRMDGGIAVLAATGNVLARMQAHRKYVVAAAPLAGGRKFVTASWDHWLAVHSLSEDGCSICTLARQQYDSQIADVAMLEDGITVAVAVKGTNYMHVYNTATAEDKEVNLNDVDWDDHLSFSATALALSPCGKFLLVATDGPRMLVLRTRDWKQQTVLYGLQTEQFHMYAVAWFGTAHVIAAATGGQTFIFNIASGKIVEKLAAHPGSNTRALATDTEHCCLVTGSFDKTVKIFGAD